LTISRVHTEIAIRNGRYSVTDLENSNGTYVNGEKLVNKYRELVDGDIIGIGHTEFKCHAGSY